MNDMKIAKLAVDLRAVAERRLMVYSDMSHKIANDAAEQLEKLDTELTRLRGSNETLHRILDEKVARIIELEEQNRIFRAAQKACEGCDGPTVEELAKLRADMARLDWLSTDGREWAVGFPSEKDPNWWLYHNDAEKDASGPTLRAAIDAAMEKGLHEQAR